MQARLRAQLGDRSEYSGERRRRSVVVASIVLTITDPLRGSYPLLCNLQAALIRSCGASFACMELTIISRFQRPQSSRKSLLHPLFYSFSVLSIIHVRRQFYSTLITNRLLYFHRINFGEGGGWDWGGGVERFGGGDAAVESDCAIYF